jgi:cysteine desulfurase
MIYLDYNATAPLRPVVKEAIRDAMDSVGNPSSIHGAGRAARRLIETARHSLADLIQCDPTFVTFTSGATEANNTVLTQVPVERILVSAIEHPSIWETAEALRGRIEIGIIPVTADGRVDLAALETLLAADRRPALVSVMLANNETGVIQPLAEIVAIAKRHGALVHTDAVQALGKMDVIWDELNVDFLSLSAHKMGGPAGVGTLVYNHDQPILRLQTGGGQERRRRAGTENLIGIAGFGAACTGAACQGVADQTPVAQLAVWHQTMEQAMVKAQPKAIIFGATAPRLGNVTQIALPGVTADKQLMALDLAGFAVSSGSACSSGSIKPSHVLQAMGVADDLAKCAIRVSSGWATTEDELKAFTQAWIAMADRLKKGS